MSVAYSVQWFISTINAICYYKYGVVVIISLKSTYPATSCYHPIKSPPRHGRERPYESIAYISHRSFQVHCPILPLSRVSDWYFDSWFGTYHNLTSVEEHQVLGSVDGAALILCGVLSLHARPLLDLGWRPLMEDVSLVPFLLSISVYKRLSCVLKDFNEAVADYWRCHLLWTYNDTGQHRPQSQCSLWGIPRSILVGLLGRMLHELNGYWPVVYWLVVLYQYP